jgi:prophage regulatory protein
MAPSQRESTAMVCLVGKKELRQIVLYSPQHIARLEAAGRFPRRVRLGNGPRARVGWVKQEVQDWLQKRIELRDQPVDADFPE